MHPLRRARPALERLEERDCPSLAVTLYGGTLFVSGTPTGPLSLTEPSAGKLTVTDNGHNLGTYAVTGNLLLNLTSHPDTVSVDFGGNTFAGNVYISLGNGDPAGHDVSVSDGTVGGNVTFSGGSGVETESIGFPAFTPIPTTVRGSVQAIGRVSGGGDAGPGDALFIGPGSTVNGDVTTTQIDNVDVGEEGPPLTTVGGNLSVNDGGANASLIVNVFGNVGKTVTVTGTRFDDVFVLTPASPGVGGQVGGSVHVDLGNSSAIGDVFTLDTGTTVAGSASLLTGASAAGASPSFLLDGAVNGSLTVNLGGGDSRLFYDIDATVGGSMYVTGGNGDNIITADGTVGGNLQVGLGSGDNAVILGSAPGGQLVWSSGNGSDTVQLGHFTTPANSSWNVHMTFGTGDDTLILSDEAPPTQFISGLVDMGGPPGGNTFSQGADWTIVPPFQLQNV